jgi:ProP effector
MNTSSPSSVPSPTARALLKEFQEKFVAFREYLPLAIGIDKQLLERIPGLDRKLLRIALGIHTKSSRYLKSMAKATVRFDLDGNSTNEVSEAHRTHASEMLRERFKKEAENRKAQLAAEKANRAAAKAQSEAEEAARIHAEKLNQLAAKFSRQRG